MLIVTSKFFDDPKSRDRYFKRRMCVNLVLKLTIYFSFRSSWRKESQEECGRDGQNKPAVRPTAHRHSLLQGILAQPPQPKSKGRIVVVVVEAGQAGRQRLVSLADHNQVGSKPSPGGRDAAA